MESGGANEKGTAETGSARSVTGHQAAVGAGQGKLVQFGAWAPTDVADARCDEPLPGQALKGWEIAVYS